MPRIAVPFNHKVFGTRWVYKVKSDYTIIGGLAVQGWSQRPGMDCGATLRLCVASKASVY